MQTLPTQRETIARTLNHKPAAKGAITTMSTLQASHKTVFQGYKTCISPVDEEIHHLPPGSIVALLGGPAEYPEILALHIARTCTPTLQITNTTLIIPSETLDFYLELLGKTGMTAEMISYNMNQDNLRIYTHRNPETAVELARADVPPREPWIRVIDTRGTGRLTTSLTRKLRESRGLNLLLPGNEYGYELYPLTDIVLLLTQTSAGNVELKLVYSSARPGAKATLYYKVSMASILFSMESRV